MAREELEEGLTCGSEERCSVDEALMSGVLNSGGGKRKRGDGLEKAVAVGGTLAAKGRPQGTNDGVYRGQSGYGERHIIEHCPRQSPNTQLGPTWWCITTTTAANLLIKIHSVNKSELNRSFILSLLPVLESLGDTGP